MTDELKPCPLDKPILRDLFWFIVLPYRFRQWLAKQEQA